VWWGVGGGGEGGWGGGGGGVGKVGRQKQEKRLIKLSWEHSDAMATTFLVTISYHTHRDVNWTSSASLALFMNSD